MYIEALQRQLAVCSFDGAARLTQLDRRYWNVVSICGPQECKASLPHAKTIHYACFDDVEDGASTVYRCPRATDLETIFTFIQSLERSPAEPLMIHCQQGISRSAAVALSWIYRELPEGEPRVAQAIEILLSLRPRAKPNRLVLVLGLELFLETERARKICQALLADPRLECNRFRNVDYSRPAERYNPGDP